MLGTGATLLIRRRVAESACRALKPGGATGLGESCDPPIKRVQRKSVERGSDVFQHLVMVGEVGEQSESRGSGAAVGANSCADQNVIQMSEGDDWECSCVMETGCYSTAGNRRN